jgi:hypothetical protein
MVGTNARLAISGTLAQEYEFVSFGFQPGRRRVAPTMETPGNPEEIEVEFVSQGAQPHLKG